MIPDGFEIVENVLAPAEVSRLLDAIDFTREQPADHSRGGIRNLLDLIPDVAQLANSSAIRNLVEPVLGPGALAVKWDPLR